MRGREASSAPSAIGRADGDPGAPEGVTDRAGDRRGSGGIAVDAERVGLDALFLNGNAQVIAPNVRCTNGIIHGINNVLVPPSAS